MPRRTPEEHAFGRLFVRRSVDSLAAEGERGSGLRRVLGPVGLTLLGLGAIGGAGMFVLAGVAAKEHAGPAVALSLLVAALVAALAALAYAELASMMPAAGSAYTYAYASMGELVAWLVAWGLVLAYGVGAVTVAIGWSGHAGGLVADLSNGALTIPAEWMAGPLEGGFVNLPAALIVLAVTALLLVGARESANVIGFLAAVKVAVVVFIVVLGFTLFSGNNLTPFYHSGGGLAGVFSAAGLVFFAFVGFDAVSTAAEETRSPRRNVPIGILAALGIAALLHVLASIALTGMVRYTSIDETGPFAAAFRDAGNDWANNILAAGAAAGITSVLVVLLFAQPRIFFAVARDGLLPASLARVHPRWRTPHVAILLTGLAVTLLAGLVPIALLANVSHIGALFAFGMVSASVIVLRYAEPDVPRGFRVPGPPWLLPGLGVLSALVLLATLPALAWLVFLAWSGLGLVLYASYGYYRSRAVTTPASRAMIEVPTPPPLPDE